MGKINEGTPEWFINCRRQIVSRARALACVDSARRSVTSLIVNWENPDPEVRAGLHSAAVISYARPFSQNQDAVGKWAKYPVEHLTRVKGFDPSLHYQLLDLRNKMIAHHDSEYLAAKLLSNLIVANGADFLVGVSVHVQSLYSIEDPQIPNQYGAHFDAVIAGIYAAMRRDLGMYFQAGQKWLGVLKSTARSSEDTEEFTVGPGAECGLPTSLEAELGQLSAPSLSVSSNGYSYLATRHLLMMEGELNVEGADGSAVLEIRSTPRPTRQTDR